MPSRFQLQKKLCLFWVPEGHLKRTSGGVGQVTGQRGLQSIFLSYVNKDLIFFLCHWIVAIGWPVINFSPPKGFPGGMWNLKGSTSHFSLHSLYQMSACSNQSNKTRNSPAGSHTPNKTKVKVMPRNQKPNGINAKRDFPRSPRPATWQSQCLWLQT